MTQIHESSKEMPSQASGGKFDLYAKFFESLPAFPKKTNQKLASKILVFSNTRQESQVYRK